MRIKYAVINKELAAAIGIDTTFRQSVHGGKYIIVTENEVKGIEGVNLLSREEVYREINNQTKK